MLSRKWDGFSCVACALLLIPGFFWFCFVLFCFFSSNCGSVLRRRGDVNLKKSGVANGASLRFQTLCGFSSAAACWKSKYEKKKTLESKKCCKLRVEGTEGGKKKCNHAIHQRCESLSSAGFAKEAGNEAAKQALFSRRGFLPLLWPSLWWRGGETSGASRGEKKNRTAHWKKRSHPVWLIRILKKKKKNCRQQQQQKNGPRFGGIKENTTNTAMKY